MDIEQQYDKIYRYCLHRLGDGHLAEDVTQETFARYFAAGPRGTEHALRWLYTVARNLCTDQRRRPPTEPLPEELPAPGDPDSALTALALRQAVAALPAEDQELILMRYVNQEPVSVIASVLGMSRFGVYRRTRAALETLRRALEEDEP